MADEPLREAYYAGIMSRSYPEIWAAYTKLDEVNNFFAVRIAFERECVKEFLRGRDAGKLQELITIRKASISMGRLYEKAINTVGVSDEIASDLGAHVKKSEKRLISRAISAPSQKALDDMLFSGLLACFSFTPDYMSGSNNMRALLRKAYILEGLLQLPKEELQRRSLLAV